MHNEEPKSIKYEIVKILNLNINIVIFNSMRAGLVRLQQYAFSVNSIWATA